MRTTSVWIGVAILATVLALSSAAGAAGGGKGSPKGGAKEHLRVYLPNEISDELVIAIRAASSECETEAAGGKGGKPPKSQAPPKANKTATRTCVLAKLDGNPQFQEISTECRDHNHSERAANKCIARSVRRIMELKGHPKTRVA